MLTSIAPPKVNLFLHVKGKRPDGYHLLESLVVFPGGGDRITIQESRNLSLEVTGPFLNSVGSTDENLALKAARLLNSVCETNKGAHIVLEKNLPVAAGIGGGSADAAAVLKSLNLLWNIDLSDTQLSKIGLSLGADVPACLYGRPTIMSGIGEHISGIAKFPEFHILLVNSGFSVSTKDVFSRLKIPQEPSSSVGPIGPTASELFTTLAATRNDLEAPALDVAPEIGSVLSIIRKQKHCRLARMSGSGATCFGLFDEEEAAEMAVRDIRTRHPEWWVQAAAVGP